MIFLKKTFVYLKKSFLPLMVALTLTALTLGYFTTPFSSIAFLPLFFKQIGNNLTFIQIFFMLVSESAIKQIYPYILILFIMILGLSYAFGIIEKHFKTGKLSVSSPIRSINNSALSVVKTLPILVIIAVVMMFVQAGLISIITLLFANKVLICLWVTIISLLIFIFVIMIAVVFCVWAIVMQTYGYSYADAFVESMRTISKKWFSLVLGLFVPFMALSIPRIVMNVLNINDAITRISLDSLTYLIALLYCSAYVFVSVYELNGLIRRDEKSYY